LLASRLGTPGAAAGDPGADRSAELHAAAAKLAEDVSALSHELHSSRVTLLGVATSTRQFCQEFGKQHGVVVACDVHDVPSTVGDDIALCVHRVLQEALHNALKHSGQRHFAVHLWGTGHEIRLQVRDEGIGFDPRMALVKAGIGLISMEERARLVGGEVSIVSAPQRGATVVLRVPIAG